jgi:hypothetical protein
VWIISFARLGRQFESTHPTNILITIKNLALGPNSARRRISLEKPRILAPDWEKRFAQLPYKAFLGMRPTNVMG